MTDSTIAALAAATGLSDSDLFLLAQGSVSKKVAASIVAGYMQGAMGQAQTWTPTLSATTTAPTLGAGSICAGEYMQIGKWVFGTFRIRFGTSGRDSGSGIWHADLPVPAKGRGYTAGMTSDPIGWGKIWRGDSSLDLGYGAHLNVTFHTVQADNSKCLIVLNAAETGGGNQYREATTGQTGIGTSATALKWDGTNAFNISVPVHRNGSKWLIRACIPMAVHTGGAANKYGYLDILKDAAAFVRASRTFPVVSNGLTTGVEMLIAERVDANPTVGSHVYSLQGTAEANTLDMIVGGGWVPTLTAIELANEPSGSDYVADNNPWIWANQAGQGELWCGGMLYEAA